MTGLKPITSFLQQAQALELDVAVLKATKRAFIDTIAVMLAGSKISPLPQIIASLQDKDGGTTIVGKGCGYSLTTAAFVNATAAHVLDMDDCDPYMGHPSAVLVATILALTESLSLSGQKALQAYAAAYQVGDALGKQCCYDISAQGWHATSVLMTLISSWCAGFLRDFSADEYEKTATVAASLACGVRGNFGTPVKPVHTGIAARNALLVSQLVKDGVYGSEDALFGKEGFFNLFAHLNWSDQKTLSLKEELLERRPLLVGTQTVKVFPSCSSNHQAVFAFLDILKEHPELNSDLISSITVFLNKWALGELVTPKPKTGVEARFSPAFHFALALNHLPISPDYFQTQWVKKTEIQDVIKKTVLQHDRQYDNLYPWPARVVVQTTDGREYVKVRDHIPGEKKYPLTDEELEEKFLNCSMSVLGKEKAKKLIEKLKHLENIPSMNEVTALMY